MFLQLNQYFILLIVFMPKNKPQIETATISDKFNAERAKSISGLSGQDLYKEKRVKDPFKPFQSRFQPSESIGSIDSQSDIILGDSASSRFIEENRRNPSINSIELERINIGELEEPKWSLFESIKEELADGKTTIDNDSKTERIIQFFSIPFQLEKFMFSSYLICLDSFLHNFTILPLRMIIAFILSVRGIFSR
jgi:hypothetical protein